jgi:hypothetical protein
MSCSLSLPGVLFSVSQQCFSFTINQSTLISVMTFQNNEQEVTIDGMQNIKISRVLVPFKMHNLLSSWPKSKIENFHLLSKNLHGI